MRWPKGAQQGTAIVGGTGKGNAANQLNFPLALSFDRHSNLYVVDCDNHRIQRFNIQLTDTCFSSHSSVMSSFFIRFANKLHPNVLNFHPVRLPRDTHDTERKWFTLRSHGLTVIGQKIGVVAVKKTSCVVEIIVTPMYEIPLTAPMV